MRIHIISNLFAPDELAGAALFTDLARFLKDRGHDVRVTCTFSYYPAWRRRPEDAGQSVRDEICWDIPVRRVSMYIPKRPTGRGRMLSDLSFFVSLLRCGRHRNWTPDVILTALPMLSQCLAQRFLYPWRHIPRLIVVQDFAVEAALDLKILHLPGLAWALLSAQKWALRSAQTIQTISPMMLEKLRRTVGTDRQLSYVPNWIHSSLQQEIDRQMQNGHARQAATLFYSGNVGVKQGLPEFLDMFTAADAAGLGWRLDIHGGGAELERLRSKTEQTPNCCLCPVLDEPAYVQALLACSACLVTQKPGVGANFLPSKILPALATGTPVLAVCDPESPLGREVQEGGFGAVRAPGDTAGVRRTLLQWKENPDLMRAFGIKARERASLYHRTRVLSQYEEGLARLVYVPKDTFAAAPRPVLHH